ncbi:MAG: prepilin-type N-terminal cleavage/methylation domain-containing protein [Chlorobia bacterium]|nr:prepilin-type N-terminal cleavage/methylation domain-containing protein [Fimbriimonadaceae bacterium]
MNRKSAFTLIELLVVIAIIAILAAIIFPVFARAKVGAYRSSDITNMNSLRTALHLYRADNGAYPPALLGYVNTYSGNPLGVDVIPADQLKAALYAKRVESLKTFTPANERAKTDVVTTAEWPPSDPRAVGTAPQVDTNGDGNVDALDDNGPARQANSIGTVVQRANPIAPGLIDARFYNISGYDTAEVRLPGGGTRRELRYALFWSGLGLTTGGVDDDPRQLGYTDPPENTVITWNSYFRDYDAAGIVARNKNDIVLFLGGSARPYDAKDLSERSWRVLP